MDEKRIGLAHTAFQNGDISKSELAGIMHQEGAITDQEYSGLGGTPNSGFNVPEPIQSGAKYLGMADRGPSAVGGAIESALLGKGGLGARNAGATATFMKLMAGSPPENNEKTGSFIGGLGSPINLAANYIPGGKGVLGAMAKGAGLAVGSNILNQAEQGHIDPSQTATSGAGGAGLGLITHGIASTPKAFLKEAPSILEKGSGVPKAATQIFMDNPGIEKGGPTTAEGVMQNTKDAVGQVRGILSDIMSGSKLNWDEAAAGAKIQKTVAERAESGPWSPQKISHAIEGKPTKTPGVREPGLRMLVDVISKADPEKPQTKKSATELLKALYTVRGKIGDHFKNAAKGITETATEQQSGLAAYRTEINSLIEKLPGSESLRSADVVRQGAKDIATKIGNKLDRPGDALEFLKKTFAMGDANSEEDLMNLRALEKFTGKPVIDDLFNALTKAHFSPALADNMIKRSFMGISPFLASAGLRVLGLPFQFSLPAAAALTTAGRSPQLMGKLIRSAQAAEPYAMPAAKATAVAGLTAMRKMMGGQ